MNDDPDDPQTASFEAELLAWKPAPVSGQLENRIAGLLDASRMPLPRHAWWRRLGFARPTAALGWGLVSPAMAVAVTLILVRVEAGKTLPSPPPSRTESPSANPGANASGNKEARSVQAVNTLEGTIDEGVVTDGNQGLVRRVRYRSTDHVQWRNPRTGAEWEVSYPREDVLLVPINAE